MKRALMFVLQAALVLFGVVVLAGMLWEPHLEGRNVNADFATIYFRDPFLAYAYLGSLPFFVGLYQATRFLGFAGSNEASSPVARMALRRMKFCALAVVAFILGAEVWIGLSHGDDDAAGVFALGIAATVLGLATFAVATALERALRNAGLHPARSEEH